MRPWSKTSIAGLVAGVATLGLGLLPVTSVAASLGSASAARADCLSAPAHARQMGGGDGTDPNSVTLAETKAMEAQLQAGVQSLRRQARHRAVQQGKAYRGLRLPRTVQIDTYVHVITRADGTGGVTDQQIRDQIKVMNDGFAGRTDRHAASTPFRFRLKAIDRTANDDWYAWSDPDVNPADDTEAKQALHRGSFRDLNVYIAGLEDGLLGYAYYPNEVELWQDGLVLLNDSLPGGAAAPYNEGDTATHEVGHWLYLLHTFENGCTFPGDEVPDTAYQDDGDNIFECDESLDTCAQPGRDPVHNFMSYGDDPCLDQFTTGQSIRMTLAWLVFRARR